MEDLDIDYEKDIYIDEEALDVEWLEHSRTVGKYIKYTTKTRTIERKLHERVKTRKAELIQEANLNPDKCCHKDKPNASDIDAYIRLDKIYKQLKRRWIEAQEEAEYAELAQKEFSWGRKAALENLVTLHGQQYFAGPRTPRNLRKERKEITKFNVTIAKGLKRK